MAMTAHPLRGKSPGPEPDPEREPFVEPTDEEMLSCPDVEVDWVPPPLNTPVTRIQVRLVAVEDRDFGLALSDAEWESIHDAIELDDE